MKIFSIATKEEGYFNLLNHTAARWGYDLQVLGWQEPWKGFAWKLELYIEALSRLPAKEPVVCADGYDVVVIGPATEMLEKFKKINKPIVFSGQRYFPNQRWMQVVADKVMSNNLAKTISAGSAHAKDYSRPCTGLMIGYAGELLLLFQKLLAIEKEKSLNDDQTLLNIYFLEYPDLIHLDFTCSMFQNLWRTRGGIYGKLSPGDRSSEIEIVYDEQIKSNRVRNKEYQTMACFLHAPFNLDIGILLNELNLNPPRISFTKDYHYLRYSILHHINRSYKLYWSSLNNKIQLKSKIDYHPEKDNITRGLSDDPLDYHPAKTETPG